MKYILYAVAAIVIVFGAWLLLFGGEVTAPVDENGNAPDGEMMKDDAVTGRMEEDDHIDGSIDGEEEMEEGAAMTEGGEMETGESGAVREFLIAGGNFSFDTKTITVEKGQTVRIVFTSIGGFHDWAVDEFNARTDRVNTGETASVEFVADRAGEFEYYCSVGSHRALGMKGTLVVEE